MPNAILPNTDATKEAVVERACQLAPYTMQSVVLFNYRAFVLAGFDVETLADFQDQLLDTLKPTDFTIEANLAMQGRNEIVVNECAWTVASNACLVALQRAMAARGHPPLTEMH